jgi:hypothetical protein
MSAYIKVYRMDEINYIQMQILDELADVLGFDFECQVNGDEHTVIVCFSK